MQLCHGVNIVQRIETETGYDFLLPVYSLRNSLLSICFLYFSSSNCKSNLDVLITFDSYQAVYHKRTVKKTFILACDK